MEDCSIHNTHSEGAVGEPGPSQCLPRARGCSAGQLEEQELLLFPSLVLRALQGLQFFFPPISKTFFGFRNSLPYIYFFVHKILPIFFSNASKHFPDALTSSTLSFCNTSDVCDCDGGLIFLYFTGCLTSGMLIAGGGSSGSESSAAGTELIPDGPGMGSATL